MQQPVNIKTQREYQGKNATFLVMAGFKSPEWGTFLQWKELGYKVKKGAKSQKILKVIDLENEKNDKAIRTYSVFNKDQVEVVA